MIKTIKNILLFTVLFISTDNAFAKREQLSIVAGLNKPPYVFQQERTGFEIELIQNIFNKINIDTAFVFTQFKHSTKMLDAMYIDAVMTTNKRVFTDINMLSDTYISYQNVAISLKSRDLSIQNIEDLNTYSIAAFQNADKLLGDTYLQASKKSPLYLSTADQSAQPQLLVKKRVDVIVLDINIFKYLARMQGIDNLDNTFNYHFVFPKSDYQLAFKDLAVKKLFNTALKEYKSSEAYTELKLKYDF